MKKSLLFLITVCSFLLVSVSAMAQTPQPPPKVLQIIREEVKPYMNAQHEKVETGWPAAQLKANWPYYALGLDSVSGPNEAWWLTGYESFAALEKNNKDFEKNS